MSAARYSYYYGIIREYFHYMVPPGQEVLIVGREVRCDLEAISPARGVIVQPPAGALEEENPGRFECHLDFALDQVRGPFDYIILKDVLGMVPDIGSFLVKLSALCKPETRIIVYSHNYLWRPLLRPAERLRLKRPGGLEHLLSATDIDSVMTAAGFQLVNLRRGMLFPLRALGLGPLLNTLGKFLPLFDWAKLNQFQVFRPLHGPEPVGDSLTICLTCRDERENIEPLVRSIPRIAREQEILFVEGHSCDGTREEIERMIELYPEQHIRVIGQPGKGQGDAIREGFRLARGEIIILLEADMTSPPEDITYVYESIRRGYAEFIEGSRFVYRLPKGSMPLLNYLGNWFFAGFFSWLLRQSITDVLSGIKAIRKRDFDRLLLRWDSWGTNDPFGDFELLFGAVRLGLKTAWQPIHYYPRPYGRSKTRVFHHGPILARMAFKAFLKFRG